VEKPDILEAVKNVVLTNVKVNGKVRNETITTTIERRAASVLARAAARYGVRM